MRHAEATQRIWRTSVRLIAGTPYFTDSQGSWLNDIGAIIKPDAEITGGAIRRGKTPRAAPALTARLSHDGISPCPSQVKPSALR